MTTYGPTPEVSDPVADILRAAYYYGLVDGHAVIEPALVLVAAARNDKTLARPMLGSALAEARPLLAADVSAGPPRPAGEAEPATSRVPLLRETRWWVLRGNDEDLRARGAAAGTDPTPPLWGPEVAEALERAADEAASAGAARIGVAALLLGLLRSTHPAVQMLAKNAGLDIAATASLLRKRPWATEEPFTPLTGLLTVVGITDQQYPLLIRWAPAIIRRFTTRREQFGPVLTALELEILRQAVITGHPSVQAAHLPLAIVSMQEQLAAIGSGLAARYRPYNHGDLLLTGKGFDLRTAQNAVESLPHDRAVLAASDLLRRPVSTGGKLGDPSWTDPAATAMENAGAVARSRQHRDIGTTHLLAAAVTDADSTASRLLELLGIDVASLRVDLDQQLGTPP